tara:strand:+ start:228 stop:350 length:123 start_codon:yes stop_codon:yes gene_type:complete
LAQQKGMEIEQERISKKPMEIEQERIGAAEARWAHNPKVS